MKQGIALVKCNCDHEFQDKKYGNKVRVANTTSKQDATFAEVRCTICKSVQRINPSNVK